MIYVVNDSITLMRYLVLYTLLKMINIVCKKLLI